jgi:RNA polymerase sigma-70 factor (ECF subfamily)
VEALIDEQLAQRAACGDRKAFEEICALTWRQLYQYVYHRVQNREEAEDVTQEAYSRALKAAPTEYTAGQFVVYLQRAALNLIRDRWRSARVRQRRAALLQAEPAEWAEAADAAERVADRDVVRRGLAAIRPEYREVLELRIVAGLSTAETAARLGRTEAAIRSLQYRAIQALKEEIE